MKSMLRFVKSTILVLTLVLTVPSSFAFSLLGPFEPYQVERIGYNLTFNSDVGGPMNLGEEYRWNVRTVTYGFDPSFVDYFGQRGVDEVRKAIDIMNSLPPVSKMSSDLSEFPQNSRRINYEANALLMLDLKSETLGMMMEEMGLASPERYVWTLRQRIQFPNFVNYWVIRRNFDPITWQPTLFVNGTLYTYGIFEFPTPAWPVDWADAVESVVDPLAPSYTAVASIVDGIQGGFLNFGEYVTGLTRDDVGGLRYLYRPQNYNVEAPIPGTILTGGIPGTPYNGTLTNLTAVTALRPGVDKVSFVEAKFDSTFGNFISITNQYVDYYVTNNVLVKNYTERAQLFSPDILFAAADIGFDNIAISRTSTAGWTNNTGLNGSPDAFALAGPGVINPVIVLTFNKVGQININGSTPGSFLFEPGAFVGYVWGAFDGTTNRPFLFPQGASIEELENQVLGH